VGEGQASHRSRTKDASNANIVLETNRSAKSPGGGAVQAERQVVLARPSAGQAKLGALEKFFDGPWNRFVGACRWPIIILGVLVGVYAAQRSREIRGLSSQEQYFADDYPLSVAFRKTIDGFNDGDYAQTIVVDIMWGLEGINKTGVDFFNASDLGEAIWDTSFEMSAASSQQQLYDFCMHLRKQKKILY